jgi:sigma-B regulation protein RsbU (phosphoserine phosphatase)
MKQQVRWPLWGTVTALVAAALTSLVGVVVGLSAPSPVGTDFVLISLTGTVSKIAYLLIPISFAFGIVKYRLMDIDVIIRKTIVYSAVSGVIIAVYLLVAGVSGLALVRSAGLESQTVTVVATLAVLALFVPVRNRIQAFVDRLFFRRERSFEDARRRISESVARATSLDTLLADLAETVQQTVNCRTVAVLVRRPGSDRFHPEATVGFSERAAAGLSVDRQGLLTAVTGTVIELAGSGLVSGARLPLRPADAEMAVIARRAQEPVGLIILGRKLDREAYDDEDVGFLSSVADQLSLAVGRLRQRRAETELSQAREIQERLLPSEIPQIEGVEVSACWQPAREASGDYYDVIGLDEQRLALCIGDVAGKGMPAALLMSSLQAAVKAVAPIQTSPQTVCSQVRSVVEANLSGGKFVTFFFGVVDSAGGSLRYSNAGHNPPILVRADGAIVRLDAGGPAIARLLAGLPYDEAEVPLYGGDRVVLFTDGVTEAMSAGGEMYGDDRLEELVRTSRALNAAELERRIRESVLEFSGGELEDDLTIVVAAVRDGNRQPPAC